MNKSYYKALLEEIKASGIPKQEREIADVINMEEDVKIEKSIADRRNYIRASEIGHCIRRLYFRIIGIQPEIPKKTYPYLSMTGKIGDLIHRELLSNDEIYKLTEQSFEYQLGGLTIHGRFDGYRHDGTLVEIKTVDSILRSDLPRNSDIMQFALYAYIFPHTFPDLVLKKGELLYVSRGKVKIKSYEYDIDSLKRLGESVEKKLTQLSQHIKEVIVPSIKNEFIDTTQCMFCEFKKICSAHKE